jgi:hypothetical protein
MLYKEKYIAAFSETSDPNHFVKVYDDEDEAVKFLWDSYNKASWKSFGGWNMSGCIPQHYILPKYKDIVAD